MNDKHWESISRYQNPRFYVNADTHEIIVSIGQSNMSKISDKQTYDVRMFVKHRRRGNTDELEWLSYAVDEKGYAHFEMHEDFVSDVDRFPRGLYDARIMIGNCEIGKIEIVKAPMMYVKDAKTIDDKCHGDTCWVEPGCPTTTCPPPPCCGSCNCGSQSGCDACNHQKQKCPSCITDTKPQSNTLSYGG